MSTRAHGRETVVQIDNSAGAAQTISGDVDSVNAPTDVDSAEVTGFGDNRKSFIIGQINTPITMSGPFGTAAHSILSGLVGGTVGYTFVYQPKGTATGLPKLSGEVLLSSYQLTSPIGGRVGWNATLVPFDNTGLVWGVN